MTNSIKTGLLLALLTIVLLTGCTSNNQGNKKTTDDKLVTTEETKAPRFDLQQVEEQDYQGNKLQFSIINNTGQRHGRFLKLNEQGDIIEEANYMMGKLDGNRVLYYPNRDTQIVETHVNGSFQGPYRSFYEDNQLRLAGEYLDNQMQGIWKMYYETGELKEEVTFTDNMENGPFTEYHKNGQISVTGSYKNGDNEHGTLKFYDEDGVHFKTMECNEGLCRTTWKLEDLQ